MSTRLTLCIREIKEWISSNRLKLNADKTNFIWLGTRQQLSKVNRDSIVLDGVNIKPSLEVTLLGVVIDEELKFTSHIKRLTGRCYIKPSREVTLLGVVIDEELKFTSYIKRLTGRCYYQL